MSDNNKATANANSKGIGFVGLLTIVFVVLKLVGVIDWSWFWILSPHWISAALVVFILILFMVIFLVKGLRN